MSRPPWPLLTPRLKSSLWSSPPQPWDVAFAVVVVSLVVLNQAGDGRLMAHLFADVRLDQERERERKRRAGEPFTIE